MLSSHTADCPPAPPNLAAVQESMRPPAVPGEAMEFTFYEGEIPGFVEEGLERLYANIYCTLARIAIYEPLDGISTLAGRAAGELRMLVLFRRSGACIQIVNQQIALSGGDVAQFAAAVFARYAEVQRIEFYALDTRNGLPGLPYVCQQVPRLEENIVVFPESSDVYRKNLVPSMRGRLTKTSKKIRHDFPSCAFEVVKQSDIHFGHISALMQLIDQRMKAKGLPSYIDQDEIRKVTRLVRTHGYLGLIRIEGEICAANLCYAVGHRHFTHLIAHEPRFDKYGLGNQLQLRMIEHAIAEGAKELWMMGGRRADKERFLAVPITLDNLTIYRSPAAALRCGQRFATNAIRRRALLCKNMALDAAARDTPGGSALAALLGALRATRSRLRRRSS